MGYGNHQLDCFWLLHRLARFSRVIQPAHIRPADPQGASRSPKMASMMAIDDLRLAVELSLVEIRLCRLLGPDGHHLVLLAERFHAEYRRLLRVAESRIVHPSLF